MWSENKYKMPTSSPSVFWTVDSGSYFSSSRLVNSTNCEHGEYGGDVLPLFPGWCEDTRTADMSASRRQVFCRQNVKTTTGDVAASDVTTTLVTSLSVLRARGEGWADDTRLTCNDDRPGAGPS